MPGSPSKEPSGRTIRLPEELARQIEERIRDSSFGTVEAFVTFVMARLVEQPGEVAFSEEDEKTLKERLRSLGYID